MLNSLTEATFLILIAGAIWSLAIRNKLSRQVGPITAVIGSVLAAGVSGWVLFAGQEIDLVLSWSFPLGSFHIGIDSLTAIFILPVAVISALAAVYGRTYLRGAVEEKDLSYSWGLFNLFVASMFLVLMARNGFLFLAAWEIMSLSSFFLMLYDHNKPEVGRAGWIYFIAAHIGVAFLLVMFVLLDSSGTMEFDQFSVDGRYASIVFVLGLIGFGSKAGIVPLHVWLPEAHPVAPSHVSAVMSGVMIKLGIYGILRMLLFLGDPNPWWGWSLVAVGAVSGILGVLFALAQHDLKRLLAYHSVENIGIIFLGLGIGVIGIASGNAIMATMGLCGGLLHVLNHAVFKSLLFMGAGAVQHATGTLQLDRLGGLLKRMPVTGVSFLVGSIAISALPPLNGFVSEFFIYYASLSGVSGSEQPWAGVAVLASLAVIGGLAAACFCKACGVTFLGEPRSEAVAGAHEAEKGMLVPMIILAGLCLAMGLSGVWLLKLVLPAATLLLPQRLTFASLHSPILTLERITVVAVMLIIAVLAIAGLRKLLLRGRSVREDATWGCGYTAPTAKMQYTASSFVQPIVEMFAAVLRPTLSLHLPRGLFPKSAGLHSHTDDLFMTRLFRPVVDAIARTAQGIRGIQAGKTHLYILYIAVTILVLLFWRLT